MPLALSKYYVERKFPDDIKSLSTEMVVNIRNTMIDKLKKLEWLDKSTREYAIEKVLNIKYTLAYSDFIMNIDNIYNHYKLLEKHVEDNYISLLFSLVNLNLKSTFSIIYNENPGKVSNDIIAHALDFIIPTYVSIYFIQKY